MSSSYRSLRARCKIEPYCGKRSMGCDYVREDEKTPHISHRICCGFISPSLPCLASYLVRLITGSILQRALSQIRPLPLPSELFDRVKASEFLLAFDFDGTLTPIVPRPDGAILNPEVRQHLAKLARYFRVVVCSGRALKNLVPYIHDNHALAKARIDLIGNHGLEWLLAERGVARDFTPPAWYPWRAIALKALRDATVQHGGEIEDKEKSLTIHFRHSGFTWWSSPEAYNWLTNWTDRNAQLIAGKFSWNILPPGMSKGEALIRYALGHGMRRLIYFGDEQTDETVFVRNELEVFGVKVGDGPTSARYRVADSAAVHEWLKEAVRFINDPCSKEG